MLIEVGAPAMLPLGLVKFETEVQSKICLLGLTVKHPPVQIFAQAHSTLQISGPRADLAYQQAHRFLQHYHLKPQGEVEIEYTIPNLVGLGSEASQGLALAKALAWVHDLPSEAQHSADFAQVLQLEPRQALEVRGFEQGGLLLLDLTAPPEQGLPPLVRRLEIEHSEKEAWAFVFYFPDDTSTVPETLETEQWANLLQASSHLSSETGQLVDEKLWPAVANDDFETFAQSLLRLHQLNEAALGKAGHTRVVKAEDQAVLEVMRENGAVAWGQNLSGYSFYGLIKGGQASRDLRKKLRDHIGFFGGTILATITDNRGAAEAIKNKSLDDDKLSPIRVNKGS
jgi:predicted sugar kinase